MSWYTPRPVRRELAGDLVCTWTAVFAGPHALVPDGCVDVLFESRGGLWVCGPETHGWTADLPVGTSAAGLRFRPGIIGDVLRINMGELRDRRVPADAVLTGRDARELTERLAASKSDSARAALLESTAAGWLRRTDRQNVTADGLVDTLGRADRDVPALARDASLTERQLRRKCVAAFGYGPASLRAVLRLQRLMASARRISGATLSELAHHAGYSDHAHLARDCRHIAGITPSELLAGQAPDWHGGTPWWLTEDVRSVQAGTGRRRVASQS